MKRIQQHLRYDPGPTRLYLDELDEILKCLRSSTEGVEIRTAQFQLEGADTLAELKRDVIHELTIQSRSPSISLYLWPRGASLEAFQDDPQTRGVFEAVKDILASNRASFTRWSDFPMLGGAFLGLSPTPLFLPKIPLMSRVATSVLIAIVGLAMSSGILLMARKRYSTIVLSYRAASPSFWKRRRDEILLALIAAIVGSLITLAITKVLG